MRHSRIFLVGALILIFLGLSFNAYACLVPQFGGMEVTKGSDCAMPEEQPARQQCDAFKTLGVQTVPPFQPLPDTHAQCWSHDLTSISILHPVVSLHRNVFGGPPLIRIDILDLTSLLRI